MNYEGPTGPLPLPQAADLLADACEFAQQLAAGQRETFVRNVVLAVADSFLGGALR